MGASYYISFSAQLDPNKCDELQRKIDEADLSSFFSIEHHGDTARIECEFSDKISYVHIEALESLLNLDISEALLETILVTEEYEGDQTTFAIGPDKEKVESQYALDQIRQIFLPQLTKQHKLLLKAHLRDN